MGLKRRVGAKAAGDPTYRKLVDYALSLPGAEEHFPWGERVAKVGGKVFAFLGVGEVVGMSVKLPISGEGVLAMPFAVPTGYGLGKAGWVSITSATDSPLPLELLCEWVLESYRAIAPKKWLSQLG